MIPQVLNNGKNWANEKKAHKKRNLLLSLFLLVVFMCVNFVGVGYAVLSSTGVFTGTTTALASSGASPVIEVNNATTATQIQNALNDANPGDTVAVTLGQNLTNSSITIQNGVNVELDLNGNDFSNTSGTTAINVSGAGDVTICNSQSGDASQLTGKGRNIVTVTNYSGNLTVENVNFSVGNGNTQQHIALDGNNGTFTLRNVGITSTGNNSFYYNLSLTGTGTLYLENCNFSKARTNWVYAPSATYDIYINGGTYQGGKTPGFSVGAQCRIYITSGSFAYDIRTLSNVTITAGSTVTNSGGMYVVTAP